MSRAPGKLASSRPGSVAEALDIQLPEHRIDFLNVVVAKDNQLFLDPIALIGSTSPLHECHRIARDYFGTLLRAIKVANASDLDWLTSHLREMPYTRLGLCERGFAGSGLGDSLRTDLIHQLSRSKAVSSGVIEDIEDVALFVPGIAEDRVSDLLSNIISHQLSDFTKMQIEKHRLERFQCEEELWGWNHSEHDWAPRACTLLKLPRSSAPLLLVPRRLTCTKLRCGAGEFQKFIESRIGLWAMLQQSPTDPHDDAPTLDEIEASVAEPDTPRPHRDIHRQFIGIRNALREKSRSEGWEPDLMHYSANHRFLLDIWTCLIIADQATLKDIVSDIDRSKQESPSLKSDLLALISRFPALLRDFKQCLYNEILREHSSGSGSDLCAGLRAITRNDSSAREEKPPLVRCPRCNQFVTYEQVRLHKRDGCAK